MDQSITIPQRNTTNAEMTTYMLRNFRMELMRFNIQRKKRIVLEELYIYVGYHQQRLRFISYYANVEFLSSKYVGVLGIRNISSCRNIQDHFMVFIIFDKHFPSIVGILYRAYFVPHTKQRSCSIWSCICLRSINRILYMTYPFLKPDRPVNSA